MTAKVHQDGKEARHSRFSPKQTCTAAQLLHDKRDQPCGLLPKSVGGNGAKDASEIEKRLKRSAIGVNLNYTEFVERRWVIFVCAFLLSIVV